MVQSEPSHVGSQAVPAGGGALFWLALLFVVVGIYPTSPVLILVMGSNPTLAFVFASGAAIFMMAQIAKPANDIEGHYTKLLRWLIIGLGLILVLKIGVNYASIAIREFIILVIAWFMLKLSVDQLSGLVRRIIYILAILMFASLIAIIASYYLGISDYVSWNIKYLNFLSPDNPLMKRRNDGFFTSYYMPFYLAVIPAYSADDSVGFGLAPFQRQDFIFTEWSYLSYYIAPLMFYAFGDRRTVARKPIIALFAVAFLLTFSVWGVVVVAGVLAVALIAKFVKSPRIVAIVLAVGLVGALATMGVGGVIGLLGGNKLSQFYSFFGDQFDFSKLIRPFGVGNDDYLAGTEEGFIYYGAVNILFVYGMAGMVGFASIAATVGYAVSSALIRTGKSRALKFAAIAASLVFLLGLKLSIFVPLYLFLFSTIVVKLLDCENAVSVVGGADSRAAGGAVGQPLPRGLSTAE